MFRTSFIIIYFIENLAKHMTQEQIKKPRIQQVENVVLSVLNDKMTFNLIN